MGSSSCAWERGGVGGSCSSGSSSASWSGGGLDKGEVERYARQLVLPSFGVARQRKLKEASVLVVGAGGLGSPVCLYLAAAGVGRIGVTDQDDVEKSNLHRQILHDEAEVGSHKAVSASKAMRRLNSGTEVEVHLDGFRAVNALGLVEGYDVVVDASDNPATRYCVNDACVIAGKPLVSGAAIGTDGQLSVYNHGDQCPCYRCVWPDPPQEGACQRCSDSGVLGVLPGIIGTLQALETIKVLTGAGECCSQKLLMFDGLATSFRSLKLRPRQEKCLVCGSSPAITRETIGSYDYEANCGGAMHDKGESACLRVLPESRRVSCEFLRSRIDGSAATDREFVVLDVRPKSEYDFAHLRGSVSLPMDALEEEVAAGAALAREGKDTYVVCRRGNDSQVAVDKLLRAGATSVFDVEGGLQRWSKAVDPTFPLY
ncbi:adenylyltransferase/sulfurtransferase MOCS3 [Chloropicon primus]|uniref:Adenylyltransferase and sulfurtransferase MOCS3 n=1 Tax=Chloropicon primus TaxID=1764295 RepID=A0A5B8MNB8_9CHLO|nr:adenylyltransferase/sulfurtransferase MOCS3 [Chloropicon primus]UPR00012.1 adenylyltransferase/sulfurtransferase MOCS3 [Chloropicon primus]|eukprot:QDZ20800.1 adenylyltransferase/sulfurtransferase MOCS3 [Chloropicon primus]